MSDDRNIISEDTQRKQKDIKENAIEDVIVDLFLKIYFEDGGKEVFPTTEDLIIHIIDNRFKKMPFDLQRRISLVIQKRNEPRKD